MKLKNRKIALGLLSLTILMAILSNLFSMPVNAALTGNQDIGVIFAFGGNHGDITLQGGWHKGASNNRFAVWYTKADRKVMYCLEPGNGRANNSTASSRDTNYIRNCLSNRFLSGTQIERFIGYILAYGYTGSVDGGSDVRYYGHFSDPIRESGASTTTQIYEACQILIWETVVGERDANFNHVAPDSGYTPCKSIHTTSGNTGDVFETYYQGIANSVKNYGGIPSFMAPNIQGANAMAAVERSSDGFFYLTNTGKADLLDWTFTVVDSNRNVIPGSAVGLGGNLLKVRVPVGVTEAYLYGYNRFYGNGAVAWSSDGSWGPNSPSQDLVQSGFADPVSGYVKFKVDTGSLEIIKESDYGVVEGLRFNVYFRGDTSYSAPSESRLAANYIITDSSGHGSLDNLPFGWYEIEEVTPDHVRSVVESDIRDELTGNAIVYLAPGENNSLTVHAYNYVNAVIRINKTDKVTGEAIGFTSFNLYKDFNGNGIIDSEDEYTAINVRDDDGDGVINFENISVGNYLIREAETYGYYSLSNEVIPVSVISPEVYEVSYENDALGSVTLTKVDADNTDFVLTEAVFEVYRDVDKDGLFNAEIDEFVSEIRDTNQDGIYSLTDLSRDSYLLFETVAPEGYELDPNVYPFVIELTNLDVTVSNSATGFFVNKNTVYGTRFISSSSSDLRVIEYGTDVELLDNVNYRGVIPGETYKLQLTLYDAVTRTPLLDENGEALVAIHLFVPENSSGMVQVPITVNSSCFAGRTIVAFERMFRNNHLVGNHEDFNSSSQTLSVPSLSTTATSADGELKEVTASSSTELIDTVEYINLEVGREYRIEGVIMDRTTGLVYRGNVSAASSEVYFTPTESNGSANVRFSINTIGFSGDLVVFEELYDVSTGILIAVHKDIDSEGQTVTIKTKSTPTPTPTGSVTPTPRRPGTPSTGEGSGEFIKLSIAGTVIIAVSVLIITEYFRGFKKEE